MRLLDDYERGLKEYTYLSFSKAAARMQNAESLSGQGTLILFSAIPPSSFCLSIMSDLAPNPELLRSLGRLGAGFRPCSGVCRWP